MRLENRKVAILIADGYHEHEFWFPYYRFREEGAELLVAGPAAGTVYGEGRHGTDGLPAAVEHPVDERCVRDDNLITAVYFVFLPEQFRVLIPAIEERPGCSPS